jgi:hypothetical protein
LGGVVTSESRDGPLTVSGEWSGGDVVSGLGRQRRGPTIARAVRSATGPGRTPPSPLRGSPDRKTEAPTLTSGFASALVETAARCGPHGPPSAVSPPAPATDLAARSGSPAVPLANVATMSVTRSVRVGRVREPDREPRAADRPRSVTASRLPDRSFSSDPIPVRPTWRRAVFASAGGPVIGWRP